MRVKINTPLPGMRPSIASSFVLTQQRENTPKVRVFSFDDPNLADG
jgi:hypothetical protein